MNQDKVSNIAVVVPIVKQAVLVAVCDHRSGYGGPNRGFRGERVMRRLVLKILVVAVACLYGLRGMGVGVRNRSAELLNSIRALERLIAPDVLRYSSDPKREVLVAPHVVFGTGVLATEVVHIHPDAHAKLLKVIQASRTPCRFLGLSKHRKQDGSQNRNNGNNNEQFNQCEA